MAEDYPSIHFDRHNSGYIPDPQRPLESFDTVWKFSTGSEVRASPVVTDELVVVGDMDGTAYGIDAIDGWERWQTTLDVPAIMASPAIVAKTVIVSGYDDLNRSGATVFGLDVASGDVLWTRDFGQGGRTAVAADDERVYVVTHDSVCYALVAQTGETAWQVSGERAKQTPALSGGVVILGDGEDLVGLDAARGTERWRTALNGHIETPPVVDGRRVYVITRSSQQWCLDTATGDIRWHTDIGEAIREHPDTDDPLYPLGGGVLDSKPVTDGDSLIVGIYMGLAELDAVNGRLLGYYPLGQRVRDPLLIGGEREGRLYGSVSSGGLTEIHLTRKGASVLQSGPQSTLSSVPAYTGGVFYVASNIGHVYALA